MLSEFWPREIKFYLHARARAVELGADGLEKYPEDIVGSLKKIISTHLARPEISDKSPDPNIRYIHEVFTGLDKLLTGMINPENISNSTEANCI